MLPPKAAGRSSLSHTSASRYRSSIWVLLAASSRAGLGEGAGLLETHRPLLSFPFLPLPPYPRPTPPAPFQLPLPYSSWVRRAVIHAYRVVNRPLFRHSMPTKAFYITPIPGLDAPDTRADWESPEHMRTLPAPCTEVLWPARLVRTHTGAHTRTSPGSLRFQDANGAPSPARSSGPSVRFPGASSEDTGTLSPARVPEVTIKSPRAGQTLNPLCHMPGTLGCAEGCSTQVLPSAPALTAFLLQPGLRQVPQGR